MRKLVLLISGLSLLTVGGCYTDRTLSKEDAALLGALGGAAIGAATHKHYKTSAKDAALYGAVAGGILGYVFGDDRQSTHTVNAESDYEIRTKDGRVIHVHEDWYTVDSQPAPSR
jgi:outer membrane lipoprotein SlyB